MTLFALLGKLGLSSWLLGIVVSALMLSFAGTNIAHSLVPHVVNAHAYYIACGGVNLPECG